MRLSNLEISLCIHILELWRGSTQVTIIIIFFGFLGLVIVVCDESTAGKGCFTWPWNRWCLLFFRNLFRNVNFIKLYLSYGHHTERLYVDVLFLILILTSILSLAWWPTETVSAPTSLKRRIIELGCTARTLSCVILLSFSLFILKLCQNLVLQFIHFLSSWTSSLICINRHHLFMWLTFLWVHCF